MKYPWKHNRRFNSYPDYMRKVFGTRVQKVAVDAGFTCPNRDGKAGTGGCTFCNNDAFNPSYCSASKPVRQQLRDGKEFHKTRYRSATKYMAYFQAYSNTYKPLEELRRIYQEALDEEDIVGLVIGTRPDCIDDQMLDYFRMLSEKKYIVIEYGIESVYNKTLKRINRGHTFEETAEALMKTAQKGIKTGGHMIFGLPGESMEEMLDSAEVISKLPLHSVKFHQLQIMKGTVMAKEYLEHPECFHFLPKIEAYLEFIVQYTENLNPSFILERIAGETPPRFNVRIPWDLRYDQILVKFENLLEERDTWQGKKWMAQRKNINSF
ncbi:MAG: TIGR01212 family radical SAM protein [Bacteroidales bacterium]|nr:TIGR01212 family radical SAM protein [Bacteroidales bacterium]